MIFQADQDYILENHAVRLRPLVLTDSEYLEPFAASEPELWRFSLISAADSGMESYINQAIRARNDGKEYAFIVFDKRQGKYAGSTRFYDIQTSADNVQLGFTWYGKDFQGTGLNKHCKYLMLEFAFEVLKVRRVEFRADNDNKRSIAAMTSIGCTVEGILRSNGYKADGTRRDSIILSILSEEWYATVKSALLEKLL